MDIYKDLVFPRLPRDPEQAHEAALSLMRKPFVPELLGLLVRKLTTTRRPVQALGFTLGSPVGFSAGVDKNAVALKALSTFFAFGTVGTITPHPQVGGARPRVFRLTEDRGIINRMGFPNDGADAIAKNLMRARQVANMPIGASLGKMKDTPNEEAYKDYIAVLTKVRAHVDYFEVNVSSPNTEGLRDLQEESALRGLLREITSAERNLAITGDKRVRPILVKISPDLSLPQLDTVLQVCLELGITGIVAANTTSGRKDLISKNRSEKGGASGPFLFARTCELVSYIAYNAPALTIIASGGISSPDDAAEALGRGATLIQIYTSLTYEGPALPIRIAHHLARR